MVVTILFLFVCSFQIFISLLFRNMSTEKVPKSAKTSQEFHCEKCNFVCSKKSNWNRHVLTAKHKNQQLSTSCQQKVTKQFACECGKEYKERSGLWKHTKTCKYLEEKKEEEKKEEEKKEEEKKEEEKKEDIDYKELLIQAMKQMSEQQKVMSEQQKQITEMIPLIGNNNNNTNNKFNLNIFLNETCKDALNINDFIDSLQLQLNDLDKMNELGYVNGLTRIFLNGLNQLDLTKRPLHCSDAKREILYVKENDEWEKEESKTKLNRAISSVGRKTLKHFPEWMKTHPNCNDSNSQENEEYHSLIKNTITQNTEDNKNKVAKNIIKDVVIDK